MDRNDIKLFLFVLTFLWSNSTTEDYADPLKAWNLQDAVTYPGQAFIYQLPLDYKRFEVTEKNLNFLPDWLKYDVEQSRLVGVSSQDNINFYEIDVQPSKELLKSSHPPFDSFSITVSNPNLEDLLVTQVKNENNNLKQPMFDRGIYCRKKKETTTTVVLELDYDDNLSSAIKFSIIETFSKFYEIPLKAIKLLSSIEIENRQFLKSSIIYTYPEDFSNKYTDNKVFLQWTIGCGKVQKKQLSVLKKLEETNRNLKNIINYDSMGFYVTNNNNMKEIETRKKHKRYLQNHYYPTATATISILPPSNIRPKALQKNTKSPKEYPNFHAVKTFSLIKVLVGEVYRLNISKDFFSEPIKHLRLTTSSGQSLSSTSWIKLDSDNLLYGIPLLRQQGMQQYLLKARDSHGNEADLKLDFNVVRPMLHKAPFKMSVIIDNLQFEKFTEDVDMRMDLTEKLAAALGDSDSSNVLMTDLFQGSVEFTWTNKSMFYKELKRSYPGCAVSSIKKIFNRMINAKTNHLEHNFDHAMGNYRVSYAEASATGDCKDLVKKRKSSFIRGESVHHREGLKYQRTMTPSSDDEAEEGLYRVEKVQNMDELFKQILVPSLIVVALVLVALVIACVAFSTRSNKKKEKLKGVDDCLRKGTPVIFAHELDENPSSPPSKRPLITSTQRSPKPPNYHQHLISATPAPENSASKLYVAN